MAVDQRMKDAQWTIKDAGGNIHHNTNWEAPSLAVLMDIRDRLDSLPAVLTELKTLNALLSKPGLNSDMWGPAWLSTYLEQNVRAKKMVEGE